MSLNPESTQFGERAVNPDEKTGLVHGVFENVAKKYDIMNDLMSGGIHRLWKDKFVRMIRPRPTMQYLDVAGGTGDIAFRIHKKLQQFSSSKTVSKANITICDLTENMVRVGRNRAIDKGLLHDFNWTTGNAETLPFEDNSFDVYTIAFGLRNVTRIDTALKEAYRVLRPGGRFFCLEFSHVRNPALAKAYDAYSRIAIPQIGEIVANDRDSYQYLIESIRKFPTQKNLENRLKQADFQRCSHYNLSAGIACIHTGIKL